MTSLPKERISPIRRIRLIGLILLFPLFLHAQDLILVVGAPGEPQYATHFANQAKAWTALAERSKTRLTTIGLDGPGTNDLALLHQAITNLPPSSPDPLYLVLIGHGTFDGREARFNLRGPDVTATNLQEWLRPVTRPTAILNTASASAPFLKALARTNRVILTATRSGNEVNATRLGQSIAEAIQDPKADLDQDGDLSLLELFLNATARTGEFYKSEGRLASEHALLDDNADALGTPADWFRGTRATKKPSGSAATDGLRTHQFILVPGPDSAKLTPEKKARRDEIELAIARLRDTRPTPPDDAYYAKLEVLLLELARLMESPQP
jgi:hypothetical protein